DREPGARGGDTDRVPRVLPAGRLPQCGVRAHHGSTAVHRDRLARVALEVDGHRRYARTREIDDVDVPVLVGRNHRNSSPQPGERWQAPEDPPLTHAPR